MADDITLTANVQSTILAVRQINALIERSSLRIASGQRITALEEPAAFFEARTLSFRASRLTAIKDDVNIAVSALEAAVTALDAIDDILVLMKTLAEDAKDETDEDAADSAAQFDDLREQVDDLASDASFNAINLIRQSPDTLNVSLNEDGSSSIQIIGIASDIDSLGVLSGVNDYNEFVDDTDSDDAITAIDSARTTLEQTAASIGNYSAILSARSTFIDDLTTTLDAGAGKLVNTNLETEAALLLALQTQRQLAISSLSVLNPSALPLLELL